MANEIRPEDIRRIAAQKEREVFGESGSRRFAEPHLDFAPQHASTNASPLPPLAAEPRPRGPYDRHAPPPPPVLELSDNDEPMEDDDLGLPPTYSPTDYGREEVYDEEVRPRRRRLLPMTAAFLALVGFAAVVWYAYDWGSGGKVGGAVPIIQASTVEEKVKPTNEAGMDVPNQETTVLNPQAEEPKEEVLMPAPEEPVVRIEPQPQPQAAAVPEPLPEEESSVVVLTPSIPAAPPSPSGAGSEQPAGSDSIADLIASQGKAATATATATATAPTPVPAPAPAPAVTELVPAVTPAAAPAVPLPAPSTGSEPVIAAGAFLIQLASLPSADAAEQTWSRLQKKHAALLGDMAVNIQKADIDGKGTYFRVQAGPLPNRATADDMCAQLKAAQQDCIVVKR